MFRILETTLYQRWRTRIKSKVDVLRIDLRIQRLKDGNFGDSNNVGDGVFELRMHFGPGYRVYCIFEEGQYVILLAGGTKRKQSADILKAKKLALRYREVPDETLG